MTEPSIVPCSLSRAGSFNFAQGNGGYGLASADGWNGTPMLLDTSDAGDVDDWVYGLDVHGDDVAASI